MRVLITASTFPLRIGDGLPRFVYDLGQALAAHAQVTVLAPHAPGAARRERMGALDVHRFAYFWPRRWQRLAYGGGIPENVRRSMIAKLQPPGFVACQARAVRALVRERGIDVVNSHWLVPQGLSAALVRGRPPRFAHVVTLHGGDSYLLRRLPGALSRFVVARSDAVIAVSSNVRANLDAALGRPSQATLQPVGVHLEAFRRPAPPLETPFEDGYLLFVGRLVPIKGAATLLRALPRVLARHPKLGLAVVGYGPEDAALRRLAAELGVADSVVFTGARPHDEIVGYLQGCRAAVVPSIVEPDGRAEGLPSVILEALAAGAPLVASAAGGVPDLIRDGENGWLAAPGDPDALAERLLAALDDPPGSALRREALRCVEALDWSRVAERTLAHFEGALSRGAGTP